MMRPRPNTRGVTLRRVAAALLLAASAEPLLAADQSASGPAPEAIARDVEQLKAQYDAQPSSGALREQLALGYNALGVSLANRQQWDPAVQQFLAAQMLEPDNTTIQQNLLSTRLGAAFALYNARKSQQAKTVIDQALRYPVASYEALLLAGQLAYENQRLKEAESYWTRALKLNPKAEDV